MFFSCLGVRRCGFWCVFAGGGLRKSFLCATVERMKNQKKIGIKIVELEKPKDGRRGRIKYNGREPLPHEKRTIECLADYGFDVETIIPSNVPGSRNPDILMMGTFWEMKGPTSINFDTIAKRFKTAIKQSEGKAVFDLRGIRKNDKESMVEKDVLSLFVKKRGMRRVIIIKTEKVLDVFKNR